MSLTPTIRESDTAVASERYLTVLIIVAGLIFYLPYLPKQFVNDDWLWLAAGKRVASDAELFLQRPVLRYYRPLTLLYFFVVGSIAGLSPQAFGAVSLLLHLLNVLLLRKILTELQCSSGLKLAAMTLFAFHALVYPTIGWISAVADVWVTTLSLLFGLTAIRFSRTASHARFVQLVILGLGAMLFKESGIVTAGLYFLALKLLGKAPFGSEFRGYSIATCLLYSGYTSAYLLTRDVVDREIAFGVGTLTNLWFLAVYQVLPLSKQFCSNLSGAALSVLKSVKVGLTLVLPGLVLILWRVSSMVSKFFLGWTLGFLGVIALFDWRFQLFALYPETSISRFFYSGTLGIAAIAAWMSWSLLHRIRVSRWRQVIFSGLAIGYIGVAYIAVDRISRQYVENQALSLKIRNEVEQLLQADGAWHTLRILTDDMDRTPQFLYWPNQLSSMIYVLHGRTVDVRVEESDGGSDRGGRLGDTLTVMWDVEKSELRLN